MQNAHVLNLRREEQADIRVSELRRARRDAYVAFLDRVAEAVHLITKTHDAHLSSDEFQAAFTEAWNKANSLVPLINVVAIEGPIEVLECARELRKALYGELKTVQAARQGRQSRAAATEAADRRRRAVSATSSAAREALGSNMSTR
ncbi:hypothetical protein ACIBUY_34070 [Streptomyces sp. NPDC050085]|uniref:hypothetical protein n=1 Tax=Streptomyces sp. NPDC050085 TaxID=3365600 RepID=UPI0037873E1E